MAVVVPILKGMDPIMPIDQHHGLIARAHNLLTRYYPIRPRVANIYRLIEELLEEMEQLHAELEHFRDNEERRAISARQALRGC